MLGRRYRQSCPLWPIKKKKRKRKRAQTCNYSNKTTPKRELGERVGKSETKEKSKEGEKLVGGREGGGKVNDNRKTDSFFGVFTISVYRRLVIISINKQEVIFLPVKPLQSTSCFPALRANDKQHLFVRQPKSHP